MLWHAVNRSAFHVVGTMLLLLVGAGAARSDPDPILKDGTDASVWGWQWNAGVDMTFKECGGGSGTLTVSSNGIVFDGQTNLGTPIKAKTGTWEFDAVASKGKAFRHYKLKWNDATDNVDLKNGDTKLIGGNGTCAVEGTRQ